MKGGGAGVTKGVAPVIVCRCSVCGICGLVTAAALVVGMGGCLFWC